jgi:hypothetical protein
MHKHDKKIMLMSQSWRIGAASLIAWLALGCGRSSSSSPSRPDAAAREAQPEVASGPETGPEAAPWPNDPASCAAYAYPAICDPGPAMARIESVDGGPSLASVVVASPSPCLVNGCASGCGSVEVVNLSGGAGDSCDLIVTASDGRSQSVQLTLVENPKPWYSCCQVMGKPAWIAMDPVVFAQWSVMVDFPADGGVSPADGGSDRGGLDTADVGGPAAVDLGPGETARDTVPPPEDKRDAYVSPIMPTDPESCSAATGVPHCDPGAPTAIVRAAGTAQLTKVEATSGGCSGSSCASGCESLLVYGSLSQMIDATCDLLATFLDGGQQIVHLTVVSNPSPRYACCGYPQPPYQGTWTAVDRLTFSPNSVVVGSVVDAGAVEVRRFPDVALGE